MTKKFSTLVADIYGVLEGAVKPSPDQARAFGERLGIVLASRLSATTDEAPTLRMSNLGTKCLRKLWYSINTPEKAEKLPPWTRLKFLYGDIIEELVLFLAEVSGHEVSGRQTELALHGVRGHRDAVIDDVLVDVKSASGYGFSKFKEGIKPENDAFGYLRQIGAYRKAGKNDKAAFVAVDKSQGHICVDEHGEDLDGDYGKLIHDVQSAISLPEPPDRAYDDEKFGESGNRKLGIACSYCDYKKTCYPNLRGFAYERGPKFLTVVRREPNVPEISLG